jgi:hypothetical protein
MSSASISTPGFLWLQSFTDLNYDHRLAAVTIAISAIVFLLPALFMTAPLRRSYVLPEKVFDQLLLAIVAWGGDRCGGRLVSLPAGVGREHL